MYVCMYVCILQTSVVFGKFFEFRQMYFLKNTFCIYDLIEPKWESLEPRIFIMLLAKVDGKL